MPWIFLICKACNYSTPSGSFAFETSDPFPYLKTLPIYCNRQLEAIKIVHLIHNMTSDFRQIHLACNIFIGYSVTFPPNAKKKKETVCVWMIYWLQTWDESNIERLTMLISVFLYQCWTNCCTLSYLFMIAVR